MTTANFERILQQLKEIAEGIQYDTTPDSILIDLVGLINQFDKDWKPKDW